MSYLHIIEPGVDIVGLRPIARFSACLEHASKHHADALTPKLVFSGITP